MQQSQVFKACKFTTLHNYPNIQTSKRAYPNPPAPVPFLPPFCLQLNSLGSTDSKPPTHQIVALRCSTCRHRPQAARSRCFLCFLKRANDPDSVVTSCDCSIEMIQHDNIPSSNVAFSHRLHLQLQVVCLQTQFDLQAIAGLLHKNLPRNLLAIFSFLPPAI